MQPKEKMRLVDYIGKPALLELMAEECNELAFYCLKLARCIRGENKVHGHQMEELKTNVEEEIADVVVTINELYSSDLVIPSRISDWESRKRDRMKTRIESDYQKVEECAEGECGK